MPLRKASPGGEGPTRDLKFLAIENAVKNSKSLDRGLMVVLCNKGCTSAVSGFPLAIYLTTEFHFHTLDSSHVCSRD